MRTSTSSAPASVALLLHICLFISLALASFPRAQNVTWKSTNFKTILQWEPRPSPDYSYTVEYYRVGGDRQRNPHCIRTTQTQCDLSSSMSDPRVCYSADVVSEPPAGEPIEPIEYPFTSSAHFCPYKDTDILIPSFKLEVSEDLKKTTVYVSDPLTAAFQDGRQLTIRDIFGEELEYKLTYRRNKSTGKKAVTSKSNTIELSDLDRGESYCFQVQALIRSRAPDRQLGELSQTLCTDQTHPSILDEYSVGVIAGGILLLLLLVGVVIAVTVICCKRRKTEEKKNEKEAQALNTV